MIIQCNQCNTKFKISDSKLKPEGVKVKCKKCANIFVVFPESPKEEDALFGKESIELTEKKLHEEIKFPFSEETTEAKTFEMEENKESDNVTKEKELLQWDEFTKDLEKEEAVKEEKVEERSFDEFLKEFEFESSLEHTKQEEVKEQEEFIKQEEIIEKEPFIDTSEKLTEFTPKDSFEFEKSEEFKVKEEIEKEFDLPSFEEPITDEERMEVKTFSLEEEHSEVEQKSFEEELKIDNFAFEDEKQTSFPVDEMEVKENELKEFTFEPTGQEKIEEPKEFEFEEKDFLKQEQIEQPIPSDAFIEESRKPGFLGIVVMLLIIIVVGGGGLGFMWWKNVKASESMGSLGISDVKTNYYESKSPEKVFVVTGKITNAYKVPKSFLRVKCTLIGKDNKKIAEKSVFAGNFFTPAEIKELTYEEIEKGLSNKMGKSMVNVDVPAGKSLNFMVVFNGLPEEAVAVEVESL